MLYALNRRRDKARGRASSDDGSGTQTQGLIRALEANDRFRRDGRIGGVFHPGRVSFREVLPRNSLHIVIHGNRVSAHVDEISPLRGGPGRNAGYSFPRVVAHNVHGIAADIGRRLQGLHGRQRCNLGCEVVWVDEDDVAQATADLQQGQPPRFPACDEHPRGR